MDTQLTRRGRIVAVVTLGAVVLGAAFGARSLNAIVAPGVLALAASLFVVRRAAEPSVSRTVPENGHPGETHEVTLEVDDCSTGNYAIRDRVSGGISAFTGPFHVTDARRTVSYEVTYDRRGVGEFGPVRATVTDVLGLAQRTFRIEVADDRVVVYPTLVDPPGAVRSCLETVVDLERRPGRDEFDSLREYVRGDSPRDVHWKSSAKQPDEDLVVKEFLGRTPTDAVQIGVAASGPRASADAAASAAASVAVTLLEEGVEVGVETESHSVEAGIGETHRAAILRALARLSTGSPSAQDATIHVSARDGEVAVEAGGLSVPFRGAGGATASGSSSGSTSNSSTSGRSRSRSGAATDDDRTEVAP